MQFNWFRACASEFTFVVMTLFVGHELFALQVVVTSGDLARRLPAYTVACGVVTEARGGRMPAEARWTDCGMRVPSCCSGRLHAR